MPLNTLTPDSVPRTGPDYVRMVVCKVSVDWPCTTTTASETNSSFTIDRMHPPGPHGLAATYPLFSSAAVLLSFVYRVPSGESTLFRRARYRAAS